MNVSKGTLRKRKITNNIGNILNNAHYDQYIAMQESTDLMNETVNNLANTLKTSSSYKRRKMLQERAKIKNTIQDKLFTEAVFKVFYDSLLLDEAFKEAYEEKLYSLCEQTLKQQMKDTKVTFKDLKRRNGLLESLISLCEEIAQDEVKQKFSKDDILNELDDEDDDVEITEESEEKFEDEKEDFANRIVDDVKAKVLETIEREQQLAMDKQELEDEISMFTSDNGDVPDKSGAGTMTGDEENIDDSSDSEEFAPEELDETDDSAPATDPQELGESVKFKLYNPYKKFTVSKPRKLQEGTLFGNILKSISNKAVKESASLNESINVDMDAVFSESVMILTLLESLQTIGITQYNKRELREFGKSLLAESRK